MGGTMANYLAVARTNYFRVTDEVRYQQLFSHLAAEDTVEDFTEERDGVLYHSFGAYGSIDYVIDLEDGESGYDFDYFLNELQKITPDGEAFIYQESGHEKLRYVSGYTVVMTHKEIKSTSLSSWTKSTVKKLLG